MRLTRKKRRRNEFLEFIVMMVFCFVVGYCMRVLFDECPIILWGGVGILGAYTVLLLVAMVILAKQRRKDIKENIDEFEEDLEDEFDKLDWIIEVLKIGQRVLRKIVNCFIVIGGVFFVCSIVVMYLPKEKTGVSLTAKELEEIVLQNHAKLLEDNKELQQNLKVQYYKNATVEEQLKVLAAVLVTEASYLGIEAPTLRAEVLADNLGGYYQTNAHEIVVNQNNLSEEQHVLKTLLHEMYHAYQYTCVSQLDITGDLLWAKQLAQWKEEFEQKGYDVNTNDGMVGYYTQSIEESAREYAEQRLPVYLYYMGE